MYLLSFILVVLVFFFFFFAPALGSIKFTPPSPALGDPVNE